MTGVTYDPMAFSELPDWSEDDHLAALKAFQASCPRLIEGRRNVSAKGPKQLTPVALAAVCELALTLPAKTTRREARAFFEENFSPHRVAHKSADGLLTGYYEPLIEGSRTRSAQYATPLMKRPADLVTLETPAQRKALAGLTHARQTPSGLVPFPTRAEIDAGALADQHLEFIYLANPVDIFFLQIQGSGRIQLTDESTIRVTYDGKNGHPYTSIGRYLVDKGLVAVDKMSLGALGRWLKSDLARARAVMNQNASYVFFREMPAHAAGPPGAIDVTLIAGRSLAIDPSIHALGSPIYVSAPQLVPSGQKRPFNRLMVAHDVGSAIKGPERGDIYFGSGHAAGAVAGKVKHPGNFYVLIAKPPVATGSIGAKQASKGVKKKQ